MAVITSPVVAALVWIMNWGGPHFYIYVWGFLFGRQPAHGTALKTPAYEAPRRLGARRCISQPSSWS